MPKYEQVIDFCYLTLPNGSQVNCTSITKPHKYMNQMMVCFSFFEHERTSLPDDQLIYSPETRMNKEIGSPLLAAGLIRYWNDSEHSAITIRSYDSPIQLLRSSESKAWLEPKMDGRVIIKYTVTRRVELPPPHGACKNYPLPFDADSSMVECFAGDREFIGRDIGQGGPARIWPYWVFFDYEKNYTQEKLSRELPGGENKFAERFRGCMEDNARADCDKSYILLHKTTIQRTDRSAGPLLIEIPWSPVVQLNITNTIKTPLSDFFNQVGSIFSMWIGFAIFPTYLQIVSLARRMIRLASPSSSSYTQASTSPYVRQSRLQQMHNLFISLLSWMVTAYYVVEIALIYIERPFIVSIFAEVPMTVKRLGVSLCLDMAINSSRVEKLSPDIFRTVARDEWRYTLTVDQLLRTTTELADFYEMEESDYLTSAGNFSPIIERFDFSKSISGYYTCFTTLRQREYRSTEPINQLLRSIASYGENLRLSIKTQEMKNMNISNIIVLFRDDGLMRNDVTAQDFLSVPLYSQDRLYANKFLVRTHRTTIKLFADHIKSSCWDYENKFGSGRDVVSNKCVVKKFTSKYNLWPSGYQVWRSSWPGRDRLMDSVEMGHLRLSNESMKARLDRIYAQCQRIVRKIECHQLMVKIAAESVTIQDEKDTEIILQPESKQYIVFEQQLLYTLVDLAGYIGGTIGTWMGLSFLNFESPIKVIITRLKR